VGGSGQLTLIGLFARCAPHDVLAAHRSITALRRLLEPSRRFARLSESVITRLLTARASPAYVLARRRAFAPAADPLRLSAERACTALPQVLTSSVAPWLGLESFRLDAVRLPATEAAFWRRPGRQAHVRHAPVRASRRVRTRTPSMGSTSPYSEVGRVGPTESQVLPQPEHLFATYRHPPCQGDGSPQPATRAVPATPKRRRFLARGCLSPISATNLLSRVPAGTRHSQAWGSRPSDRCNLSRPSARAFARVSKRDRPQRRRLAVAGCFGPRWRRS
jgi:hypothetical protein